MSALVWSLGPEAKGAQPDTIPPARKLKVFLLAGQSNMEGKGDGSKLTAADGARLEKAQKHVRFAYNRQPVVPLNVTAAGAGNKKRFGIDYSFGPELFFGLGISDAWPNDDILLIKRSLGATSLYGCWNPDWTVEKATKMGEAQIVPLFADFLAYIREVLAPYKREDYEFSGMLWVQGEADSNVSKNGPEPADTYGQNLRNLIQRIRQETGAAELPFIMVDVGGGKVVEGMKATANTMKAVSFISQSKDPQSPHYFPKHEVGHYDYEGQKRIGTLLADAYLKNYATK